MKKIMLLGIMIFSNLALYAIEDEGYFLSFSQKGQLIWRGQIQDSEGNWYNIRMVPGYVAPSKLAGEAWGDAAESFGEYLGKEKYKDMAETSGDVYEWAFDDCINKFIIKGIPDSWSDYFGAASNKVEKRIFGWHMAYPVAVFQSFVDNIFRVTAGFTGCVLGATAGTVVVPGYYMMNSTVKGGFYFIGPGMILPISGYTWNTMISPPLSIIGQKPSEARSDGYWVTKMSSAEFEAKSKSLNDEDFAAIADWGNILSQKLGKYDEERMKAQRECDRKVQEVYEESRKKREQLKKDEEAEYRKTLNSPENKELVSKLDNIGLSSYTIEQNYPKLKKALMDKGMTEEQVMRTNELLRRYSRAEYHHVVKGSKDKTDPVTESINVLKNTDK